MKILVVDDSVVYRSGIRKALSTDSELEVVKAVSNGELAVEVMKSNPDIDLITLDLEMPVMNGIETIKEIRAFNKKVIILVFSAISVHGADTTLKALRLGANDFVTKVENTSVVDIDEGIELIRQELIPKVKAFDKLKTKSINRGIVDKNVGVEREEVSTESLNTSIPDVKGTGLVCIGCSTGGPDAVTKILNSLSAVPQVPVLLVQHMPPIFTTRFAKSLTETSNMEVIEAKEGDKLIPGKILLAPGDYHMKLVSKKGDYTVSIDQTEKECFVRPAVDVTFRSVADNYSGKILAIILTGMGEDGKIGMQILKNKKSVLCVQDEQSSVVWGMPGAVVRSNVSPHVLSLKQIAELLSSV